MKGFLLIPRVSYRCCLTQLDLRVAFLYHSSYHYSWMECPCYHQLINSCTNVVFVSPEPLVCVKENWFAAGRSRRSQHCTAKGCLSQFFSENVHLALLHCSLGIAVDRFSGRRNSEPWNGVSCLWGFLFFLNLNTFGCLSKSPLKHF